MSPQVFYRKWRPQIFADVAGQKHVTQTLLNALKTGRVSHAYLFCGPRGTGKTSTGRILAKAVNCFTSGKGEPCNKCSMCQAVAEDRALDVIEIDGASNRKIDDVRELREKVNYAPHEARFKVYIIDEFHMLTTDACNALLKTLEEPPPHVIFVLATTEIHKVLPTIMSRCQRFDFHRLSQVDVVSRLTTIAHAEGIKIEAQSLQFIARSATGSLRDAENLLEQLTAYYGSDIQVNQVLAMLGITGDIRVKELAKNIVNNDISTGICTIDSVSKDGLDLRQFNREIVEYLRRLLLIKTGSDQASDMVAEDVAELKSLSAKISLPQIIKIIRLFSQIDTGLDNYSTLPLELALIDSCLAPEAYKVMPVARSVPEPALPAIVAEKHEVIEAKQSTVKPQPIAKPEPLVKPESVSAMPAKNESGAGVEKAQALSSEIERLKSNWGQVFENIAPEIKKSKAVALLRSTGVKPVAIEGDTVVLSFKFTIHKESIEKAENQQVTEKILSGYLGRSCRVRCIQEVENDHLVRAAKKLGAQVTSVEEK